MMASAWPRRLPEDCPSVTSTIDLNGESSENRAAPAATASQMRAGPYQSASETTSALTTSLNAESRSNGLALTARRKDKCWPAKLPTCRSSSGASNGRNALSMPRTSPGKSIGCPDRRDARQVDLEVGNIGSLCRMVATRRRPRQVDEQQDAGSDVDRRDALHDYGLAVQQN